MRALHRESGERGSAQVIGVTLLAVAAGFLGAMLFLLVAPRAPEVTGNTEPEPAGGLHIEVTHPVIELSGVRADGSTDVAAVGAAVGASVVVVEARDATEGAEAREGSGVVMEVSGETVVVTNAHLISSEDDRIDVVLSDGRIYRAEVVGRDIETDLAVIRIGATDLAPVEIGSSEGLSIGDEVVAVGNPGGLGGWPAVTEGVLAGVERPLNVAAGDVGSLYGMLQISAALDQGSSGGAIVDGAGRLVGISTAIGLSERGRGTGLGFGIPVEVVEKVVGGMVAGRGPNHGRLGVSGDAVTIQIEDGASMPIGVRAARVWGGAAAAGISEGEVIGAIGGERTLTPEALLGRLFRYGIGETVEVTVISMGDGEAEFGERVVDVVLEAR